MTDVHRVPESSCLSCGHRMDHAGSSDGRPIEPPNDGDLSLCIRCGGVMAFDSSGRLRGMTKAEMNSIMADQEYMNYLATLVRRIHFCAGHKELILPELGCVNGPRKEQDGCSCSGNQLARDRAGR